MGSNNWAEYSELNPSGVEFRGNDSRHMASDVVAPISITDICCRCSEIRLKGERFPYRNCIPRKSYLVPMISQPSPAVKKEWARPVLPLHIGEVNIVQPPRWCYSGDLRCPPLLPVQPPKINALSFERPENDIQVVRCEFFINDVKWHIRFAGRVEPHCSCHFWVSFFMRLNA